MAFKINKYSRTNVAEYNHGEWLLGLTDEYIKEVAKGQLDVDLTDDHCIEVAEWIESNMFDIILNACDELGYYDLEVGYDDSEEGDE